MAVTVDTAIESVRTGTTTPHTYSHGGAASGVKGVVVAIVHGTSSTDHISAVSYGGSALTRIQRNTDTATEPGAAELWFLGASVPQGTQTVSATCGTTTDDIHFVSITLLAADDTEVIDFDGVSENVANPSVTLQYAGRSAMAFAALYGGGADGGSFTPNANCTTVHDHDLGAFYSEVIRQTTAGTADFAIGGTSSSDDVAFAAMAVAEVVGSTIVEADADSDGIASSDVDGVALWNSVTASDGVAASDVDGVALWNSAGASDGVASSSVTSAEVWPGDGAGSGEASTATVGAAVFAGVYASSGTATADAENASSGPVEADGSSSGVGASSVVGAALFAGDGSGGGVATASVAAQAIAGTVFASDGAATSSVASLALFAAVMEGAGSASVSGESEGEGSEIVEADGFSGGTATVGSDGAALWLASSSSDGIAAAAFESAWLTLVVAASEGIAAASAVGGDGGIEPAYAVRVPHTSRRSGGVTHLRQTVRVYPKRR
jgi:hypothetical protein